MCAPVIETLDLEALFQLQKEGVKVIPSPEAIAVTPVQGIQKQVYADHHVYCTICIQIIKQLLRQM